MELISLKFALLLAAFLFCYYVVGRIASKRQWLVLLASSMVFYVVESSWQTLLILLFTAAVTWGSSLLLNKLEQDGKQARKQAKGRDAKKAVKQRTVRKKRLVLVGALVLCILVLGYFKYWNTILYNFNLAETTSSLGILLPLGISFYTFQSLGYLIDAYNAKYEPERNFARYLLFVSWFPQIIQGPINRYDQLAQQLFEPHEPSGAHIERGLLRLGFGILKKMAIANVLAYAVYVIFNQNIGPTLPGSLIVYGLVVYSIQMYADFSGGIDIVEGISELFGIEMAQNFRQPYFSVSLADFWRRWHMSLGSWIRDYVFYPLAVTQPSRRLGKWAGKHLGRHAGRTLPACVANIIVFIIVGVWHGAEWHYLAWGLYNGIVVALSDLMSPVFDWLVAKLHVRREAGWFRVFSMARTFVVVCVGRLFDCCLHVGSAVESFFIVIRGLNPMPLATALTTYGIEYASEFGFPLPTIFACLVVFATSVLYERGTDVRTMVLSWKLPARIALYVAIIAIVAAAAPLDTTGGGGGFLYANF